MTSPHPAARIVAHPAFTIGRIEHRMFGSFIEHLGRGVYGGIHEPSHETADERGFRGDVLQLVKELGVTTVRYPGGNFVSAYDWRDGIGPIEDRPARLDPAWHSTEPSAFGVDEFGHWCEAAGVEPMLATNFGTAGIREALHLWEYVNHSSGTALADERRRNGREEPWNVSMWCLGNEMDGPWQIGNMTAAEYGRLANRTGLALRALDPTIELVVCGSSNDRMPTFGAWEREVLEHTIGVADYISCHQYFRFDGDPPAFLGSGVAMDRFIETVASTIAHVRAVTRSDRDVKISFDEWNVWDYEAHNDVAAGMDEWPVAPRLLEDRYTAADAVVVGDLLISMINRADIVAAASMAQLVNVIGPIVAEDDGPAWRQTTFFPFADARRSAGAVAHRLAVDSPSVTLSDGTRHASVSAACAVSAEGAMDVYIVHRGVDDALVLEIDLTAFGAVGVESVTVLHHADPLTVNSVDDRSRVAPRSLSYSADGGVVTVTAPPVSWIVVRATTGASSG